MARRWLYFALGAGIGLLIFLANGLVNGKIDWSMTGGQPIFLPLTCGSLVLSIAERRRKVKSREELGRPQTLFGDSNR